MNYTDQDAARLAELATLVPWERFRPRLEDARSRLSSAGRHESPPVDDVLVIFRAILFGAIFELTDDGLAFMIGDRSSVQDFVGLDPMDEPPTARSLWLHRAYWARTGVMAEFAAEVDGRWRRAGYGARGLHSLLETWLPWGNCSSGRSRSWLRGVHWSDRWPRSWTGCVPTGTGSQ